MLRNRPQPLYRCPAVGCKCGREEEHAFCRPHWRQLPQELQAELNATWIEGTPDARRRWITALNKSIDILREKDLENHD